MKAFICLLLVASFSSFAKQSAVRKPASGGDVKGEIKVLQVLVGIDYVGYDISVNSEQGYFTLCESSGPLVKETINNSLVAALAGQVSLKEFSYELNNNQDKCISNATFKSK